MAHHPAMGSRLPGFFACDRITARASRLTGCREPPTIAGAAAFEIRRAVYQGHRGRQALSVSSGMRCSLAAPDQMSPGGDLQGGATGNART